MNLLKALRKVIFWTVLILAIVSLFWLLIVFRQALAEWPTTTLITLVLWSLILCVNSYKKLREAMIYVVTPKSSAYNTIPPEIPPAPEAKQYQNLRMRHAYYLIGLAVVWFLLFYGGLGRDDYGKINYDTPMAAFALKYFGYQHSFDGIHEFSFFSLRHEILYYTLCFLPIIILICGGLIIYDMSERKLHKALGEHEGTSSWH